MAITLVRYVLPLLDRSGMDDPHENLKYSKVLLAGRLKIRVLGGADERIIRISSELFDGFLFVAFVTGPDTFIAECVRGPWEDLLLKEIPGYTPPPSSRISGTATDYPTPLTSEDVGWGPPIFNVSVPVVRKCGKWREASDGRNVCQFSWRAYDFRYWRAVHDKREYLSISHEMVELPIYFCMVDALNSQKSELSRFVPGSWVREVLVLSKVTAG